MPKIQDKISIHCVCKKCKIKGKAFEWDSRVEAPAMCPNCHSPTWDRVSKYKVKRGKKSERK
jgi:Zn finger protein HypA/HybF involved in hydrogenase expression